MVSKDSIIGAAKKTSSDRNSKLIPILIIFLSSLIVLTWFNGSNNLGAGDNFRALDYYRFLKTVDSSWRGSENTGTPEYSLEFHVPFSLVYYPLGSLGLSPVAYQKIWMILALFLPGFFMFLFLDEFFGSKVPRSIKTVLAIFYIFNPITMIQPFGIVLTKFPVYLSLPVLAYLLVLIFNKKTWGEKVLVGVLLALASMLSAASAKNTAELGSLVLILLPLLLFELLVSKDRLKHVLLFCGIAILGFLVNFWWLYSSFYSQYLAREGFADIVKKSGVGGAKAFDGLRLLGFWALNSYNNKVPYISYGSFYYGLKGVLFTYTLTVIAFLPLLYLSLPIKDKKIDLQLRLKGLFAILMVFVGIFFVKGTTGPVGRWYQWLYDTFIYFRMFREPYSKFSLASLFAFTMALCFSLFVVYILVRKASKYAALVISIGFLAVTILAAYPMFNGEIVSKRTYGKMKQVVGKVPKYWYEFEDFDDSYDFNGRILTMPRNGYYTKSYVWESGYVGRPYELFVDGNVMWYKEVAPFTEGEELTKLLYGLVEQYYTTNDPKYINSFVNLARILNVGYMLQMNDFDQLNTSNYESWSIDSLKGFYSDLEPSFSFYQSFGNFTEDYLMSIPHVAGGEGIFRYEKEATTEDYLNALVGENALELYVMDDELVLPKIYVPDEIVTVETQEQFLTLLEDKKYFNSNLLVLSEDRNLDYEEADVEFEKVSDSRYKVYLRNSGSAEIPLIFSETFDKGWNLAKSCNIFKCSDFVDAEHLMGNLYANVWFVSPDDLIDEDGEDVLYIVHSSETRLHLGLLVSLVAILLSAGIIIKIRRNSK